MVCNYKRAFQTDFLPSIYFAITSQRKKILTAILTTETNGIAILARNDKSMTNGFTFSFGEGADIDFFVFHSINNNGVVHYLLGRYNDRSNQFMMPLLINQAKG